MGLYLLPGRIEKKKKRHVQVALCLFPPFPSADNMHHVASAGSLIVGGQTEEEKRQQTSIG